MAGFGSLRGAGREGKAGLREFQASDLCWAEGMADWRALGATSIGQPSSQMRPLPVFNPYSPPVAAVALRREHEAPLASHGQRLGAAALDFAVFLPSILMATIAIVMSEEGWAMKRR